MFLKIFDIDIHYELLSAGLSSVPVVFLHGWGGSIASFEPHARLMSRTRTCILIDFPPFGLSIEPKEPWGIDEYTCIVEEILKNEGYTSCDIVAHSFGGRVAVHMCERNIVNANRLFLTSSAGIRKRSIKRTFRIARYKFLKFLLKIHLISSNRLSNMGSPDYISLSPVMKKTFSNIVTFDQRREIEHITAKTLLFWGKNDKDTPFRFTKFYKKHIKDCEVVEVNGGHFAYIENYSLFCLCMQSFLN